MNSERLISLDAFRGFTIAAMIMVNNPGTWSHVYAPLLHAKWHGLTPTDLIFPFFIFIVGVSIALAYSKRLKSGTPTYGMYKKVIFRSLKIFAVGIFLSLYPKFNFTDLRVAGVLQRIAVVFLICAILYLITKWKTQAIIGVVLLVGYWLAMVLIPTPGIGTVSLEPGQNLAAWVDSFLLPGRMWQGTWDPEGLLSTLPAVASGISGMLAGHIILSKEDQYKKVIWLFLAGFAAMLIGYIWSWNFPLNKNLWSSSFVMVTSGLAAMILASSIYIVDILGHTRGTKIGVIFGANAISVYVLAGLLGYVFRRVEFFGGSVNTHMMDLFSGLGCGMKLASLCYSLFYIAVLFIPALVLYRKKIFIKL
ncbi:MAG: heparan-alpha-glucosaminide N-acetyltransferase domain-containing protein [Prolixibacteraceae bacterium]|jgi:predicted acyltransferase|nr:heparan-alpha-glucosaminide N-acetyltransferase domain-containing protein [Prolixibacteraceae bacterium]